MFILTRSEDVFSLFPCQAHPAQSIPLNAEAFADLEIFGRGHAIINEWFRAWIEPAVQDLQAPVRGDAVTFQRTAELLAFMQQFLQFRTVALHELATTQVDVDHFRAREAALLDRIGSYWAVFYHLLERATLPFPPALDRAVKLPLKAQTEYRNSLVAEWFFDAGLDLDATKGIFDRDAFQDLKRKISRHYSADRTVGGWDKRRFWLIFSTGLTKFITMGEKYWVSKTVLTASSPRANYYLFSELSRRIRWMDVALHAVQQGAAARRTSGRGDSFPALHPRPDHAGWRICGRSGE